MRTRLWYNQGSAGIVALIIMTVLGVFGAAFVAVSSSEIGISSNHRDGVAAQYLAEAGAQWAIAQLKGTTADNVLFQSDTNNDAGISVTVNKNSGATAGSYKVKVKNTSGDSKKRTVEVTGTINNSIRNINFDVILATSGSGVMKYVAYSGQDLTMSSSLHLTGDAGTASNTLWDNGAKVKGNLYKNVNDAALPSIPSSPLSSSNDMFDSIVYKPPIGKLFPSQWLNSPLSVSGNYYSAADFGLNSGGDLIAISPTIVFSEGNIVINADINGDFIFISRGNIHINSVSKPLGNNSDTLRFYARGNITVARQIQGKVLMMANGNINLNGYNGKINGVAIARDTLTFADGNQWDGALAARDGKMHLNGGHINLNATIFSDLGLLGGSGVGKFSVANLRYH